MKTIKILTICCMLLFVEISNAQQQVTIDEAKNAAINAFYNKTNIAKKSANTKIAAVHNLSNKRSNVLMYEVVLEDRTAILLSGSKACLPVLGYYTKSEHDNGSIFDTTNPNVPCCLRAFLSDYIQALEWSFAQDSLELHYENEWRLLQSKPSRLQKAGSPSTINVYPLLTTEWNQTRSNDGHCDVYNYNAPNSNGKCSCSSQEGGVKCPAGCVAVAMAQIMKYWNYPVYIPNKEEQYDWCNMPDELNYYGNPDYEKQRGAITLLLKDCADKVDMTYCDGDCASSAYEDDARDALVGNFGYSGDADLQKRFWWSDNKWKTRIKENLNQGRPVFYSGFNSSSGHAFVCDGYGSDDLFHFNWGWRGRYDGWFTIDDLTPDDDNFNSSQKAIFYIHPGISHDYCNFTLPLETHFLLGGTQQNVPKTFTTLQSVPNGIGSSLLRTIPSGSTVIYQAHKSVKLNPGFKVELGASFKANVVPCTTCP